MAEQVGDTRGRRRGRDGVARIHLLARRSPTSSAPASCRCASSASCRPRRSRSSTSSSTAPPPSRSTPTPSSPASASSSSTTCWPPAGRCWARSSSCGGSAARSPASRSWSSSSALKGRDKLDEFEIHALLTLLSRPAARNRWRSPTSPRTRARRSPTAPRSRPSCAPTGSTPPTRSATSTARTATGWRGPWPHDDAGRPTALVMHHEGLVPQPLFLMGDAEGCRADPRAACSSRATPTSRAPSSTRLPCASCTSSTRRSGCCAWSSIATRSRRSPGRPIGSPRSTWTTSTGSTSSASAPAFRHRCWRRASYYGVRVRGTARQRGRHPRHQRRARASPSSATS